MSKNLSLLTSKRDDSKKNTYKSKSNFVGTKMQIGLKQPGSLVRPKIFLIFLPTFRLVAIVTSVRISNADLHFEMYEIRMLGLFCSSASSSFDVRVIICYALYVYSQNKRSCYFRFSGEIRSLGWWKLCGFFFKFCNFVKFCMSLKSVEYR